MTWQEFLTSSDNISEMKWNEMKWNEMKWNRI